MCTSATGWKPLTLISLLPRIENGLTRFQEPVTVGIPFPRGVLADIRALELRDRGQPVPLQAQPLERWIDGSIRWALLDFRANLVHGKGACCELGVGESHNEGPGEHTAGGFDGNEMTLDAGAWTLRVGPPPDFSLRVWPKDGDGSPLANAVVEIRDDADRLWPLEVESVVLEEPGSLRSRLAVHARARCPRSRRELNVIVRADVFPGLPIVRCEVTIGNPERARHPRGIWELGDSGSIRLRNAAFCLRLPRASSAVSVQCSTDPGAPPEDCGRQLELYQDSSGRPNWQSSNHVNSQGEVRTRFRGFRLNSSNVERKGLTATPVAIVSTDAAEVALAVPEFWQNFPKALEASGSGITFRFFPHQFSDVHEIQGGEQKTHRFWLAIGQDPITETPLDWCRNPLVAAAEPEWYCAAEALPFLTPATEVGADDPRARLATQAIDGEYSFERQRDVIDEYGWRNFGDVYANHEAVGRSSAGPLVSHYNNQYDTVAGLAGQFMMTGDRRWWGLMDELARHVVDIDIYRTTRDKAAYNGGLFWHTFHYLDAGRSSHRSFPRTAGAAGGGPSNEHNYSTGLLLHYLLTGDPTSRETAILLGDWVVNMDDGDLTVFRWLARGRTGLASSTAETSYHGPGRGAGNSIAALLNANRLTGDLRFPEKAEELIRRCVHPSDDINSRRLLDAEMRWSYTVFLQQLGKYLLHKWERGQLDGMYAYARESLLHYARWMAVHEYPYLDKPEILEYPTETWPAQDARKSDVFYVAASHATGGERDRFIERARFFSDYSVTTLSGMATRALARPLAILLSNGLAHAWFSRHPDHSLPASPGAHDFGRPQVFKPQKARAIRLAKMLAVAGGLAGLFGAALLAFALLR
jgi:hypothetical protein